MRVNIFLLSLMHGSLPEKHPAYPGFGVFTKRDLPIDFEVGEYTGILKY
jgi:hypothetical protein